MLVLLYGYVLFVFLLMYCLFNRMHCEQGSNTFWEEHYVSEFKKKDFKKGKETTDVLREIGDKLFPFLDERNVIWWMDSGTLLGAYRNFDPIPHDDDLDIVVLENDFEKIKALKGKVK